MFRKFAEKTRKFIKECNSPEMKKRRMEAEMSSNFYNAGLWFHY